MEYDYDVVFFDAYDYKNAIEINIETYDGEVKKFYLAHKREHDRAIPRYVIDLRAEKGLGNHLRRVGVEIDKPIIERHHRGYYVLARQHAILETDDDIKQFIEATSEYYNSKRYKQAVKTAERRQKSNA